MYTFEQIQALAERYKRLYTPAVYDALDEMGYPNQCLSLDIKPLIPNMVLAGPAFTVLGTRDPRPDAEASDPKLSNFGMLEAIYPGCIVVVNAENGYPTGHWGELMSNAAQVRGAKGIVIDGGIRDGRILLSMPDWPVFARYTSPVESNKRWQVRDFQIPIALSGTLTRQVRVDPGDWIFGDIDGVIAIPQNLVETVLERAEKTKATEDMVRQEVRQGLRLKDIVDKYGKF